MPGDGRGRGVEEHRRLVAGGRRQGNRVGAQQRLRRERGHHAQPGAGEADAHHVLLGGLHGVVADGAEVAAVVDGHHPDADAAGPCRRPAASPSGPTMMPSRRSASITAVPGDSPHHPPARPRIELAGLVVPDVGAQHVRHAVRLHPAEVGHGQDVRALRGIVRAHPQLLEDLRHRLSQRRFRDQHLVLLGNLEALENHGSLLGRERLSPPPVPATGCILADFTSWFETARGATRHGATEYMGGSERPPIPPAFGPPRPSRGAPRQCDSFTSSESLGDLERVRLALAVDRVAPRKPVVPLRPGVADARIGGDRPGALPGPESTAHAVIDCALARRRAVVRRWPSRPRRGGDEDAR